MEYLHGHTSNMGNLFRSERTRVNLILILIALLFSRLLCAEFQKKLDAGSRKVIGEVTTKLKDTKRKYSSEVIWEDVDINFPVYENDTIRTDEFSEVVVKLKDGSQVKLNENTMAVFSFSTEDELNIGLTRGGLNLESSRNARLICDENHFEVKQGKLSVDKGYSKTVNVRVTEGEVVLDSKGKKEIIDKASLVRVKEQKILQKEKSAKLIYPISNYVSSNQGAEKIRFEWEPYEKNSKYILEISNASTRKLIKTQKVSGSSVEISLPVGNYRWRLVPESKFEVTSSKEQFAIISSKPLQVLLPQPNFKFASVKQKPKIIFRWAKEEFFKSYTLEISNTIDFSNPIFRKDSFSDELLVDNLSFGTYFYRILAQPILAGMQPKTSEVRKFEILQISKPSPVELVSPENNKEIFLAKEKIPQTFVWKKNNDYQSYEFEISKNSDFQDVLYREKTTEHFVILKQELNPAKYFWRVKGNFENESLSSEVRSLVAISGERIKLLTPLKQEIYEVGFVEFSWSEVGSSLRYVLELSKDPRFKKDLLSLSVEKNFLSLPIQEPGKYFWRVRLADTSFKKLNYEIGEFTVKPEPKVEILFPKDKSKVDLFPVTEVEFRWKEIPEAISYNLELVRLPEEKVILSKKNLKTTSFIIQDLKLFKRGNYELKLTARVNTKKGEKATSQTISRFEVILSKVSTKEDLKFITPEKVFLE